MKLAESETIKTALGISILAIENSSPENLPSIASASMTNAYRALMLVANDDRFSRCLETVCPGHLLRVTDARHQLILDIKTELSSENIRLRIRDHLADLIEIIALRAGQLRLAA